MHKPKFLREPELLAIIPFSKPTLHRKVKDGTFPTPVRIGARAVAWLTEEVEDWQRRIIAERDARLGSSEEKAA